MLPIITLLLILLCTILLFIWGYWRHDIVALIALLSAVTLGIVPISKTFSGLQNTAVITVACVMVLSKAITRSGILDSLIQKLLPLTKSELMHIALLAIITAILSSFMNNIGALALMMPVAIKMAHEHQHSPSIILMPLSFASVLGGLTTGIGTPPNLLISAFRQEMTGVPFHIFDYTPVGSVTAVVGILFIILIGWRLLPTRKAASASLELFQIEDYITEIKVPKDSPYIGLTFKEIKSKLKIDFSVLGLIRDKKKHLRVKQSEQLEVNDVVILQASHKDIEKIIREKELELVTGEKITSELLRSEEISLLEAVVPQGARVEGRSSQSLGIKYRFGINVIALARRGIAYNQRLNETMFEAGDVVLLQGNAENLFDNAVELGFLPLVERGIKIASPNQGILSIGIFLFGIILSTTGLLPIDIAFTIAVVLMVIFRVISARNLYEAVDWSIIILLAALIPLGQALESTGTTQLIANFVGSHSNISPIVILTLLFIITMTLSDLMNNAATAVVMAPIAISIAKILHLSIDPFLMAVAVGSSCSFLTPISHQNNTLVMGPGGYKFFDYVRMGLPLEIVITCIAIPMILWVWPF